MYARLRADLASIIVIDAQARYDGGMRAAILCLLVAGCGRIGFGGGGGGDDDPTPDGGADAPPTGQPVTVSVTGAGGEPGAGDPIVGGYVVFEGPGGSEVVQTDQDGNATGTLTDVTAIHIAYEVELGSAFVPGGIASAWRVASFYDVAGVSSLVVGADSAFETPQPISVTLPASAGATAYQVLGPIRCDLGGAGATTVVAGGYLPACGGETVPLLAMSDAGEWMDVGTMALAPGASKVAAGGWSPGVEHKIQFANVPAGTEYAAALLATTLSPTNLVSLGEGEAVPVGGTANVQFDGAALVPDRMITYVAQDDKIAAQIGFLAPPPEVAGVRTVPGSSLPRTIDTVMFDLPSRTAAWTYGPATAATAEVVSSVVSFETPGAAWVDWSSYTRATATTQTLPVLPAPLDVLVPSATTDFEVGVSLASVPGQSYQETLARVDRDFNFFLGELLFLDATRDFALSFRLLPKATARQAPGARDVRAAWPPLGALR